jgi:hypothetical protein
VQQFRAALFAALSRWRYYCVAILTVKHCVVLLPEACSSFFKNLSGLDVLNALTSGFFAAHQR